MTLCGVLTIERPEIPYWRMHDIETYNQEAKLVIMLNVFIHEFHEIFSGKVNLQSLKFLKIVFSNRRNLFRVFSCKDFAHSIKTDLDTFM